MEAMTFEVASEDHSCSKCGRVFPALADLEVHMACVHPQAPPGNSFVQEIPSRRVATIETIPNEKLVRHKSETDDSNNGATIKCNKCGVRFGDHLSLSHHQNGCQPNKKYKCEFCQAEFVLRNQLKRHRCDSLSQPTGENSEFKCPECFAVFKYKSGRDRHMRVHTGEKPYVCAYCNKRFALSWNLRSHLKIHESKLPNMCLTCGLTFVTKKQLEDHRKSHVMKRGREPSKSVNTRDIKLGSCVRFSASSNGSRSEGERRISIESQNDELPEQCSTAEIVDIVEDEQLPEQIFAEEEKEDLEVEKLVSDVQKLLIKLAGKEELREIGWPTKSVDLILEEIIRSCGMNPVMEDNVAMLKERVLENCKLLFQCTIGKEAAMDLLSKKSVESIIHQLLCHATDKKKK